jgi:hypothetical protein
LRIRHQFGSLLKEQVRRKAYSLYPITWWGIVNEYNIIPLSVFGRSETVGDALVPAIRAVDPTLKFCALERSDYD